MWKYDPKGWSGLFVVTQWVGGRFRRAYSHPVTALQLGNIRALKSEAVGASDFRRVTFTHVPGRGSAGWKTSPQVSKDFGCPFLIAAHSSLALSWCLEGTGNPEKVSDLKVFFSAFWTPNTSFGQCRNIVVVLVFFAVLLQQQIRATAGSWERAELFHCQ